MSLLTTTNSPRFRFTLRSDLLGPRVLRTDPTGWDTLGVNLHRDPKTHGLTREYTVQLGFVHDGRAYLQRAYDAAGIEADVQVEVEQLDPNAFSWLPYYRGRAGLVAASFSALEVKANIESETFLEKFLNRDTVAVDLLGTESVGGSTGPAAPTTTITLHSRRISKRYAASQAVEGALSAGYMMGDEDDPSREQTLYFGFDTPEFNEFGLEAVNGGFVSGNAYEAVPIYVAKEDGEFTFEFLLSAKILAYNTAGPKFEKVDGKCHFRINGDPTTATRLMPDVSARYVGYYLDYINVPATTITVQLKAKDQVYLYASYWVHEVGGAATGIRYQATIEASMFPGSYFRVRANTTTAPTPVRGLLAYEAFDRVVTALTDEPDSFRSDYFGRTDTRQPQPQDGPGALTMVTGGLQVRGFPGPDAPAPAAGRPDVRKSIYATFRELYDSFSAAHNLGYGPELTAEGRTVLRIEPMAYWYPATVTLDLSDQPVDVVTKPAADRHYQQLELGYATWQAETVNGLLEPNSRREWTTPLTQVKNTYSRLSTYATSGQLLEVTRRQRYQDSDTTDNRTDTTNFLVCLLRRADGSFETERDQLFSYVAGLLDPASAYNLRLTPARNLARHGAAIRAGLEAQPAGRIRFRFGEGNNELVTRLTTETADVAEKADVPISSLAAPLWRPETDTFTTGITREQLQTLLAAPRGRIRYFCSRRQRVLEGWILDFKHDGKEQEGTFDLLPCADNPA